MHRIGYVVGATVVALVVIAAGYVLRTEIPTAAQVLEEKS